MRTFVRFLLLCGVVAAWGCSSAPRPAPTPAPRPTPKPAPIAVVRAPEASTPPPKVVPKPKAKAELMRLDVTAPWKARVGGEAVACTVRDGWLCVGGADLETCVALGASSRKVLVRLDLADVPGLDGRAPVALRDLAVSLDCPEALMGPSDARSGWSVFWIDEDWNYHEPEGGGWRNLGSAGVHSRTLPSPVCGDTTAVGIYVSLNEHAPAGFRFRGSFRMRIDSLVAVPGQMRVPMDAVVETCRAFRAAVEGRKPVTIGARNSVEMPFWDQVGIGTPTFHWFAKMEPTCYARAWAPEGIDRRRVIATEVEAADGVAATLSQLRAAGFRGCLIWSVNAQDGISPFGPAEARAFRDWVVERAGE